MKIVVAMFLASFFCFFSLLADTGDDSVYHPRQEEIEFIDSGTPLFLNEESRNTELPVFVDNSKYDCFRTIFNQGDEPCCVDASMVSYAFTYEVNYMRHLSAELEENQYPIYYTYNYGNSEEVILNELGVPNSKDWRKLTGSPLFGDTRFLMSGYNNYYAAMKNRADKDGRLIKDLGTDTGLNTLKHWLNDRASGVDKGGVASISIRNNDIEKEDIVHIPVECAPAGEDDPRMLINMHSLTNHRVTIVGYNDNVYYDIDNNGEISEDEIGALKIADSSGLYSWISPDGYWYLPYRYLSIYNYCSIVDPLPEICLDDEYTPKMALEFKAEFNDRESLYLSVGFSDNFSDCIPNETNKFKSLWHSGSNLPLRGVTDAPLEQALDITQFFGEYSQYRFPEKYFLVFRGASGSSGSGKVHSASLIDNRNENSLVIPYEGAAIEITGDHTSYVPIEYRPLLPGTMEESCTLAGTYGIPQIVRVKSGLTCSINGDSQFYLHNTSFIVKSDANFQISETAIAIFNGYVREEAEVSSEEMKNYGTMDILGSLIFEKCDYSLKSGSTTSVRQDATLKVSDGSLCKINRSATLELHNNAEFTITSGAKCIVRDGSTLKIGNNARVNVENGGELIIEEGAIVEVSQGAGLFVKQSGVLNVEGSGSNPVVFDYVDQEGQWKGINAAPFSSVDINYSSFKNATWAITAEFATCIIKNSTISDCNNGIMMISCKKSLVDNCDLTGFAGTNKTSYGIFNLHTNGIIKRCDISKYKHGLELNSSSPTLNHNVITNNEYGIYITGNNSKPNLMLPSDPDVYYTDNNKIFDNRMQIYMGKTGHLYLSGGKNNIIAKTIAPGKDAYAIYSAEDYSGSPARAIKADNNYWGYSSITSLTEHKIFYPVPANWINYSGYAESPFPNNYPNDPNGNLTRKLLADAGLMKQDGDYVGAIKNYTTIITEYPATEEAYVSLTQLPETYLNAREKKSNYSLDDLENMYLEKGEDISWDTPKFFNKMVYRTRLLQDDFTGENSIYEEMLAESVNNEESILAQIDIAIAEAKINGNKAGGNEIYAMVNKVEELSSLLGKNAPLAITDGNDPQLPQAFALYQNYPNPFNPETSIRFALPATAAVKVRIFNASGAEVALLIDGNRKAGLHSVEFKGSKFTSGIYFYSLEANGNKIGMKKMMLVK